MIKNKTCGFLYWDMNERLCLEEIGELGGIEKIVLHYKWYLHINEDELRRDYLILQIEHEHGITKFGFRPVRLRDEAAVREYLLGFLKRILRKKSIKRNSAFNVNPGDLTFPGNNINCLITHATKAVLYPPQDIHHPQPAVAKL